MEKSAGILSHHRFVARLFLLLSVLAVLAPASRARAAEPGEELTIHVLTIQPGDLVFEKFGHNAIWVHDEYAPAAYRDVVYHWGIFEFEQERFFIKYARGEMDYSMGAFPLASQRDYYQSLNRTIWAQELNLTPAQRVKLRDVLRWNEQPENAVYRYNYYTDNCSTRVRDAIDLAVGGALKPQLAPKPTGTTFRWHTRRCTRSDVFWYGILHTVLGPATDRKINAWEECFLPPKLRDHLRTATTTDASGATVPLVKSEQELFTSTRPPEAAAPPNWVIPFFLVGGAIAASFVGLQRWARTKRLGKVAFSTAATIYTFLNGVAGAIGLWFWFFSEHWAAWRNENLFGYSPLALPLAFLLPVLFRKWPRARRTALWLALGIAGTTILGVLLSPILPQDNAEPMALVLPINVALAWCIWRMITPQPAPAPAM
ncbi:MAG: hypothetical protein QOF78_3160 [Phycisphaerales bacterium]|jgi:hypothetical protein|nr:hypothetical protein [Phycisphaerales bacterium]